jgi:hypothetical protein
MKTILFAAPKWLFRFGSLWAILAGFIIFFYSGAGSVSASSESGVQIVRHLSWLESQGWWGVAILIIFALLFYAVLHFYQRGRLAWTLIFGLAVITLSVLAGFSIGAVYWPGSFAVLIGLLLLPFQARPRK